MGNTIEGAGAGLLLACAACTGSDAEQEMARAILTLDLETHPVDFVDLIDEAWRSSLQFEPVGASPRPVELLGVLSVDTLHLRTDRGREVVGLHGAQGDDERLPEGVRAAVRGTYLDELRAWLTEPGARLFEVPLEVYGERGAAVGPTSLSADGRRLVSLARVHASTGREDVLEVALERGWVLPEHAFGDNLAMDPRALFAQPDEWAFGRELPDARRLGDEFRREAEDLARIGEAELQALGDEILGDVADWLGWDARVPLHFRALTPQEALQVLPAYVQGDRDALRGWVNELALRLQSEAEAEGKAVRTTVDFEEPELATSVLDMVARLNGYSPAGDTVFVIRKPELSLRMLEDVLVHEIMHQYQESLEPNLHFAPPMTPPGLLEAHAEYLSASYRHERREGYPRLLALDYRDTTESFAGILQRTGLTPDELYGRYVHGDWDRDLWGSLRGCEMGLQEFLFRQTWNPSYDAFGFEARKQTGLTPEEGPVVRITNLSDTTARAQFHGIWIWRIGDDREGSVTLEGPPFNLVLPAGRYVDLRISHDANWAEYPAAEITGLFSPTPHDER